MMLQILFGLVVAATFVLGSPRINEASSRLPTQTVDSTSKGSKSSSGNFMKNLNRCAQEAGLTGVVNCAAVHSLNLIENVAAQSTIVLSPGITLISNETSPPTTKTFPPLEKDPKARAEQLLALIANSTLKIIAGRVLKVKLPSTALFEGRARNKNKGGMFGGMGPLILGVGTRMMATIPMILAALAVLTAKALVVAKLALVISVILFVQQFFGGRRPFDFNWGVNSIGSSYGPPTGSYPYPASGGYPYPASTYGTNNIGGSGWQ